MTTGVRAVSASVPRRSESSEDAFSLLAATPEVGYGREDLTARPVKFWSVFSYFIVYDPASTPLTTIAVLHGAQDIERLLKDSRP